MQIASLIIRDSLFSSQFSSTTVFDGFISGGVGLQSRAISGRVSIENWLIKIAITEATKTSFLSFNSVSFFKKKLGHFYFLR